MLSNTKMNLNKDINLADTFPLQVEPAREQLHEIGSTVTPARPIPRSHPDPVSSHILDTTLGRPAVGVAITMSKLGGVNQVRALAPGPLLTSGSSRCGPNLPRASPTKTAGVRPSSPGNSSAQAHTRCTSRLASTSGENRTSRNIT